MSEEFQMKIVNHLSVITALFIFSKLHGGSLHSLNRNLHLARAKEIHFGVSIFVGEMETQGSEVEPAWPSVAAGS